MLSGDRLVGKLTVFELLDLLGGQRGGLDVAPVFVGEPMDYKGFAEEYFTSRPDQKFLS